MFIYLLKLHEIYMTIWQQHYIKLTLNIWNVESPAHLNFNRQHFPVVHCTCPESFSSFCSCSSFCFSVSNAELSLAFSSSNRRKFSSISDCKTTYASVIVTTINKKVTGSCVRHYVQYEFTLCIYTKNGYYMHVHYAITLCSTLCITLSESKVRNTHNLHTGATAGPQ